MALGFFRRHQKMVMIIMVVLMVSFLIGFGGFQTFLRRDSQGGVLGKTNFGDLRAVDRIQAAGELQALDHLGLGQREVPSGVEYAALTGQRGTDRAESFALLLLEAQHNGVRVGEPDIDNFLASVGVPEDQYKGFIDQLRTQREPITEAHFRAAVKDWLAIHKMFATCLVLTPPSEREISFLCRDLLEKIDLRILRFPAEKYVDPNETVDPNLLMPLLARYRNVPPGQFSDDNPFGLGYRQPDRVQIAYAFVSREVVERASRPEAKDVNAYFVAHRNELTQMTQPATAPGSTTAPAGEANRLVQALLTPEEARPVIIQKLSAQNAAQKVTEMTEKFQALVKEVSSTTFAADSYSAAWKKLLRPKEANAALDSTVETTSIGSVKLEAMVDRLAERAKIRTIVFPWGEHEKQTVSPDIMIKLEGTMTLRDALKQVCEQAKCRDIEWGMCDGFEGVLFPTAGAGAVDFFPVVVHQTGLADPQELQKDELLAYTFAAPPLRANVLSIAFTAQPFARATQGWEPLKEGQDGPAMDVGIVRGGYFLGSRGKVVWRLLKAAPGQAPQQMTDDVRRQAEKDYLMQKAFDVAYQRAQQVRSTEMFAALDANHEANAITTGMFARVDDRSGRPAIPPELGLPADPRIQKSFIDAAFSLMPTAGGEGATIGVLRLPSIREVLVMRRVAFQPVTRDDYQNMYRLRSTQGLYQQQFMTCVQAWFLPSNIQQRVGWVATAGRAAPAGSPAPEPVDEE